MPTHELSRPAAGAAALFAILSLAACMGQPAPPRPTPPQLVVYTDRGAQMMAPLLDAFEKKTGVETNVHTAGAVELLTRMKKKQGERYPADLFLCTDSAVLEEARAQKLLRPMEAELAQRVPAAHRAADSTWVGLSIRMRVLVYNTEEVKPADVPASVLDLAAPRWAGKVGTVAADNGSFISGVATLLEDHGPDKVRAFLAGLKKNSGRQLVFRKHTPIVTAVAKGQAALGYVNHYYYYRHKVKEPQSPIQIAFPDREGKGAAWNVSGAGYVEGGKNAASARAFLEFLLGPEGQKLFAEANLEYPVDSPRVGAHHAVAKFKDLKLSAAGVEAFSRRRAEALKLIQEAGLE